MIENESDFRKLQDDAYQKAHDLQRATQLLGMTKMSEDLKVIIEALSAGAFLRGYVDTASAFDRLKRDSMTAGGLQ